jgi:hypothetical protein
MTSDRIRVRLISRSQSRSVIFFFRLVRQHHAGDKTQEKKCVCSLGNEKNELIFHFPFQN